MRYIIIANSEPFYSDFLLEPDWTQVSMIIDKFRDKYIRQQHAENWGKLNWQDIPFDHL